MCEEKRSKIRLIPARHLKNTNKGAGRNEKQADFALFNLCNGLCKAL